MKPCKWLAEHLRWKQILWEASLSILSNFIWLALKQFNSVRKTSMETKRTLYFFYTSFSLILFDWHELKANISDNNAMYYFVFLIYSYSKSILKSLNNQLIKNLLFANFSVRWHQHHLHLKEDF